MTLVQAQNELLSKVAGNTDSNEEKFFKDIEDELNIICEEIAKEISADSAAIFFITENKLLDEFYMVMRGASGRLRKTYDYYKDMWYNLAQNISIQDKDKLKDFDGFTYYHIDDRKGRITNQIWEDEKGCIANSNQAIDFLGEQPDRKGRGDKKAYPGNNLYNTFRNLIGVPIFAQGGKNFIESEKDEFLSKYRVIGILKLECKKPFFTEASDFDAICKDLDSIDVSKVENANKNDLKNWCQKLSRQSEPIQIAFSDKENKDCDFPPWLQEEGSLNIRKEIADIFTKYCYAEFTRQDMELLVLLSMQVGRLMTHRIIKHAADNGIIISENEVGLLNIRWRDIDDLVALGRAAEAAMRKVRYFLESLRKQLDFEKRLGVYRAHISELLDQHGPIRDIKERRKDYISLILKLVRKQLQLQSDRSYDISINGFYYKLTGYGNRSGENFIVRGTTQFYLHDYKSDKINDNSFQINENEEYKSGNIIKTKAVDITSNLGNKGTPQISSHDKTKKDFPVKIYSRTSQYNVTDPLVKRILDSFKIDDISGIRILTDYESDIYILIDEIKSRITDWGIKLNKEEKSLRESKKEGGYRAVHITLGVDVKPLVSEYDYTTLHEALNGHESLETRRLLIPVEIQLRTSYQNSWAEKTHDILYKMEEQITQDLRDEQEILSNVLAEADWLSDIVRDNIENLLLPEDYGERRFLEQLKRRVSPQDMSAISFGIACAKEMLKNLLRYNGEPEYSYAMEVCERLFYSFKVTDAKMFLLILLRNVWRGKRGEKESNINSNINPSNPWELIIAQFYQYLEQRCKQILDDYKKRICDAPDQSWLDWFRQFPEWFWLMQESYQDYFGRDRENRALQWKERLDKITERIIKRYPQRKGEPEAKTRERNEWLERAYMLEAAALLASLAELPYEPGKVLRKRLFNDYLILYREIRNYLPIGYTKDKVIEELEHAFSKIETKQDFPRQPE